MTKKFYLIVIFFTILGINHLHSQNVSFEYDAAGNCKLKYKTVVIGPSKAIKNGGTQNNDTTTVPIEESKLGDRTITILPNPTKGLLKVQITGSSFQQPGKYTITDMAGKHLISSTFDTMYLEVDMTQLANGSYFLILAIENKQDVWKIIKE